MSEISKPPVDFFAQARAAVVAAGRGDLLEKIDPEGENTLARALNDIAEAYGKTRQGGRFGYTTLFNWSTSEESSTLAQEILTALGADSTKPFDEEPQGDSKSMLTRTFPVDGTDLTLLERQMINDDPSPTDPADSHTMMVIPNAEPQE